MHISLVFQCSCNLHSYLIIRSAKSLEEIRFWWGFGQKNSGEEFESHYNWCKHVSSLPLHNTSLSSMDELVEKCWIVIFESASKRSLFPIWNKPVQFVFWNKEPITYEVSGIHLILSFYIRSKTCTLALFALYLEYESSV